MVRPQPGGHRDTQLIHQPVLQARFSFEQEPRLSTDDLRRAVLFEHGVGLKLLGPVLMIVLLYAK